MHNDYPWRKVFAPFKSCPGFVGVLGDGGGGWMKLTPAYAIVMYQYHPAGYSSEYSAGRKFANRIFGSNNTFTYNLENNALW